MPRPFAVIGISYFLTLAILSILSDKLVYIILALSVICCIIAVLIEKFKSPAVFSFAGISILLACLSFFFVQEVSYKPAISLAGTDARISGEIVSIEQPESGKARYLIKTDSVNGKPLKIKIRLTSSYIIDANSYDSVVAQAKIYVLGDKDQDSIRFYKAKGVFLGAYSDTEPLLVPSNSKPPIYFIQTARLALLDSLNQLLPNENGGLLSALLFGDKTYLSDETVSDFRDIGVSHIVAVSGLHLTVFLFAFIYLIERIRIQKRVVSILAFVFIILFMATTGFSASVLRAGFMLLVIQTGKMVNKQADSLNSLGLAVLLITIINPLAAGNIGLQLSFFATLGIVTSQKYFKRPFEKAVNNIHSDILRKSVILFLDTIVITVSASLFTFPVILISFGRVSLITVLSNALLLYVSTPAMILGAMSAILFKIPFMSVLAYPLSMLAGLFSKFILTVSRLLASVPYASVPIGDKFMYIWFSLSLFMVAYAVIVYKQKGKNYLGITSILCMFVLSAGVTTNYLVNRNTVTISVIDIGNASSALITNKTNAALIACGGDQFTSRKIIDTLETKNNGFLDLLLIPRTASTESGAALDIVNNCKIKKIIVPEIDYNLGYLNGITGSEVSRQTETALWNKVKLFYSYNDEYCCVYADISGTGILFIFYPVTDYSKIPVAFLNSDILICRSKPPADCENINSKTVIVCSDEPVPESLVKKYRNNGIGLFSTAGVGNIVIRTQGNHMYSVRRGD